MVASSRYAVVLLPEARPIAEGCTLGEAAAFLQGYGEVAARRRPAIVAAEGSPAAHEADRAAMPVSRAAVQGRRGC